MGSLTKGVDSEDSKRSMFPWKGLIRLLFNLGRFFDGWPHSVPMPPTGMSTKGISGLSTPELRSLAKGFEDKTITLQKRAEGENPVVIEGSKYRHYIRPLMESLTKIFREVSRSHQMQASFKLALFEEARSPMLARQREGPSTNTRAQSVP